MAKLDILERGLFIVFVIATNGFVMLNLGWVFLMKYWGPTLAGIIPAVSLAALVSFLSFALLEDHLRGRMHEGADRFQP